MAGAFRTLRRSLAVQAGCSGLLALGYFNVRSAVREAEKVC